MPPRSTRTSRKPESLSNAAALVERLSVRHTRQTGLSWNALISVKRFGSSPTGRFNALAMWPRGTVEFVRPAHVDDEGLRRAFHPIGKLICLYPQDSVRGVAA